MLVCLDMMLADFELYARGREVVSVIVRERNSLDEDERERLLGRIVSMRQLMGQIKKDLELEVKDNDLKREIWAQSSGAWEMLLENDSKHLGRYGTLDHDFAVYWQQQWQKLVSHLEALSAIGQGRKS